MYHLDTFSSLPTCSTNNDMSDPHAPVGNDANAVEWPSLAPGFRFHPTDEELVTFYLAKKIRNPTYQNSAMIEADLRNCEPWELPEKASLVGEKEWYFYGVRDRKYPGGTRANRATKAGYWKATGKDREILLKKRSTKGYVVEDVVNNQNNIVLLGWKKTLVFYEGRAPKGQKTNWVMHEYRSSGVQHSRDQEAGSGSEWVVCRVFNKGRSASAGEADDSSAAAGVAGGDHRHVGDTGPYVKLDDPLEAGLSCTTVAPARSGKDDVALEYVLDWPTHHHRHQSCCCCRPPPPRAGSREHQPSLPGDDDTTRLISSSCYSFLNSSFFHDILSDTF